jgi:hypothetical protein
LIIAPAPKFALVLRTSSQAIDALHPGDYRYCRGAAPLLL